MAATPASTLVIDTEPTNTPDEFSYKHATFEEILEDLSSRFILNLPEDELSEVERVCFQVEQAHWYYEDFIRDENPSFASLPLKKFSEILFRSCPLLHHWSHDHETAFNGFMNYKTRVPVCGAIMLNETLTKCVLVKGWKSSAGWGFPKGKVNENEDEAFCAVREVLEETGYNLTGQIRRTDCIRLCVKQQPITLFVVADVPEEFPFKTQTRKEISKIEWFKLADLPTWKKNRTIANKFYLITPVVSSLKAIVRSLRKARKESKPQLHMPQAVEVISSPDAEDEAEVGPGSAATTESLVTVERAASSQGQSAEAEISSSQSSSIDPHTPSVNGDLVPHSSGALVLDHNYASVNDIPINKHKGLPIEVSPLVHNADPRSHWSRLMTRLNHSEEVSPQGTPQASTPTPLVSRSPGPGLQSQVALQLVKSTVPGSLSGPSECVEALGDNAGGRPPAVTRSSPVASPSLYSERSASTTSSVLPLRGLPVPSLQATKVSSSPDVLVKRTRQLQLLESVVAEESQKHSHVAPPLSAHILGSYPRSSEMLIPDQVRVPPLRSASVNPEVPHSRFTPYHQHKYSVPSLSRVSSTLASTSSSQRQVIRPRHVSQQPTVSSTGRGMTPAVSRSRPASAIPPQLYLAPQPHSVSEPNDSARGWDASVQTVHKGQMLSILSGRRSSTVGTQGLSHDSRLPASTAGHPISIPPVHRGSSNLLSILNNPSSTASGHQQEHFSFTHAT